MKKIVALILAVCLCTLCTFAMANDPYRMATFSGGAGERDWSTNSFFTERETDTGISFLFNQYNDYTAWKSEQDQLIEDGDSEVDVIFKGELTSGEIQKYYGEGKIIDLKPYLAEHAPNLTRLLQQHPDWEKAITLPDGSIPALPSINEVANNNAMWVNKKWLAQLKMEAPATREEFVDMLRAFKTKDPNVNGKNDEIPLSFVSLWDLKFLSHMFGFVMNDYGICTDDSGEVQYLIPTEKNREFVTWLHELWNEGLLWHDGFTSPDSMRVVSDTKGSQTYGMFFGSSPLSLLPADWSGDYEMIMPISCDGKQVYRQLQSEVQLGAFAITPHCKNPEKLVEWVDYLYSDEGSQRAQSGRVGVDYRVDSEGKWSWEDDASTVVNTTLPEHTIAEGGAIPGYIAAEFQMNYDDEETARTISGLVTMQQYEEVPYPQVYLTAEERARVQEIQNQLGMYAEQQMVWFITGDQEITDENWNAFTEGLSTRHAEEMVEIFQQAYDRQYK